MTERTQRSEAHPGVSWGPRAGANMGLTSKTVPSEELGLPTRGDSVLAPL